MTTYANEVGITINGSQTNLDNSAFIYNNRTYVPMRELFENIGATVLWDDATKSATANHKGSSVSFIIDSNVVTKNGVEYYSDGNCKLIDGKTYVPIRIILELLGFNVNWNEEDKNVDITVPPSSTPDNPTIQQPEISEKPSEPSDNEYELKVFELINIERRKAGLAEFSLSTPLCNVARMHSLDMYNRNFFSHTNPDGQSPSDRIKEYGISYRYMAENIAAGQSSPEDVVNTWMNSEGHRANILNPDLKQIGIGYYKSGSNYIHYWTQCFTD